MRRLNLLRWSYVAIAILLIFIGGIAVYILTNDPADTDSSESSDSARSLINPATLDKLAITDTPIDQSHLDEGITPPTNKWFSGFALQAEPKPGYNYPNSFLPRSDGFEFSLPQVQATTESMTGLHSPDVVVAIDSATDYKLTDYDELSVELTYLDDDDQPVASLRVASGLPYVYITAVSQADVSFSGQAISEDSWTRIKSNASYYGVNVASSNNRFALPDGESASFFSAPDENSLPALLEHADAVVKSGQVDYTRVGDNFRTTLSYETYNNQPTLIAKLPHQQAADDTSSVTYRTILGDMTTVADQEISFETPAVDSVKQLDLSGISDDQRQLLVKQLRQDIADFEPKPDTYFGGKQLYRMAQLLSLAKQLDAANEADSAADKLKQELKLWLDSKSNRPKSFMYDPSMKGIVGNEASFGADKEFNDHHFHYGYFIYAAAILAEHDEEFLQEYQDEINLLVADIANYKKGEELPLRRSFDPYAGHSWASGISPFADGNNQESTSEAINAWIGVSLWAQQTSNQTLALQADWMTSLELLTAKHYWLMTEDSLPGYLSEYDQPIASIVWGAKREYSTFFSDEPNAKLAIQFLPLSPTFRAQYNDLPAEIFRGTSTDNTYGDYILMATPGAKLDDAIDLPDSSIDDGNSRAYMYAYILSKP